MDFPNALLPQHWALAAFPLLGAVWLACVRSAPWRRLGDAGQSNVWFGAIVVLTLVWSMRAGVKPGLGLHLLGATTLTLMYGRALAILALGVVLAAVTFNRGLNGVDAWQAYALNALVLTVFPVLVADSCRRTVERHLPANFFVYVFGTAFLGSALTVMATGVLTSTLLFLGGAYPAAYLADNYFPYFILLAFSEAWLNGAAITLMVIYAPGWVASFEDRRYLLNK